MKHKQVQQDKVIGSLIFRNHYKKVINSDLYLLHVDDIKLWFIVAVLHTVAACKT